VKAKVSKDEARALVEKWTGVCFNYGGENCQDNLCKLDRFDEEGDTPLCSETLKRIYGLIEKHWED